MFEKSSQVSASRRPVAPHVAGALQCRPAAPASRPPAPHLVQALQCRPAAPPSRPPAPHLAQALQCRPARPAAANPWTPRVAGALQPKKAVPPVASRPAPPRCPGPAPFGSVAGPPTAGPPAPSSARLEPPRLARLQKALERLPPTLQCSSIVDLDKSGENEIRYDILYHATKDKKSAKAVKKGIDLSKSRIALDFNPKDSGGFYVTNLYDQAEEWAGNQGVVLEYQVPSKELNDFHYCYWKMTEEEKRLWFSSREKKEDWQKFVDKGRKNQLSHGYDFVEGPMLLNPTKTRKEGWDRARWGGHQLAMFSNEVVKLFDVNRFQSL